MPDLTHVVGQVNMEVKLAGPGASDYLIPPGRLFKTCPSPHFLLSSSRPTTYYHITSHPQLNTNTYHNATHKS